MKKKTKTLLLTALMSATVGFSALAVSCTGNLALESLVVDTTSIAVEYEVGDAVDFTNIAIFALYNDDELENVALSEVKIYLGDEEITNNLSKLTETKGEKTVRVVYTSEYGEKEFKFTITVSEKAPVTPPEQPENPDDPPAPQKTAISAFNMPGFVSQYNAQMQAATNDTTDTNFEGKFFKNEGQEYYIVGDDNAFKFLPVASIFDEEEMDVVILDNFVADSTVLVWKDDAFVALTKQTKEGEQYIYEYKDGDTVLVTENAAKNQFDFADGAIGNVFRLSVQPSEVLYEFDDSVDPVVFDVQIVDGYNIYDSKELAVIDNSNRMEWVSLKASFGLTNVTTNGVVLHQNTVMSIENIPEAFYYTLADSYNVYYKDKDKNSKTPEEFGLTRTYFYDSKDFSGDSDYVEIFVRKNTAGQKFSFYGNYFDFDASKLPLVCAFKPTKDAVGNTLSVDDTWYDTDFSNATLLRFDGDETTVGESDELLSFNNIAIRGNAENQQITVDTERTEEPGSETLVRGGGIILVKTRGLTASFENTRTYNFFISFFGDPNSVANYNRTKVYDSFQDAVFAWSNTTITITNSYFKRAGGPMIVMNHDDPEGAEFEKRIPRVTIDANSEVETSLTGAETWFKSVGADAIVSQMRDGINLILKTVCDTLQPRLGGKAKLITTKDADGNQIMNIMALLMRDATNAQDALSAVAAQGKFVYGDPTNPKTPMLDRMADGQFGQTLRFILAQGTLALNIGSDIFYLDASQNVIYANDSTQQGALVLYQALQTADYIGFNQGGISVMFELFPVETVAA